MSDGAAPVTVVREAAAADAPAIARLLAELGYPWSPDIIGDRLHAVAAAGNCVLVAEQDGEVVGVLTTSAMLVLHRPAPVGRISAFVVTERCRGQGIGRAMVAAAERQLAARGCGLLEVTSNRRREDAHAFYEHLGYERTSYRFAKPLAPSAAIR